MANHWSSLCVKNKCWHCILTIDPISTNLAAPLSHSVFRKPLSSVEALKEFCWRWYIKTKTNIKYWSDTNKLILQPLIQVSLGEPAPEVYNSYSTPIITVNVIPVPSHHFPPFAVASLGFKCKSSISLSTAYFQVFFGLPLCLAPQHCK